MTRFRRKQCDGCAFKPDSKERSEQSWWVEIISSCLHRTFYCHKTCFQIEGDAYQGRFDHTRKRDGSPATIEDHQVCAGFVKMFGDEVGINPNEVDAII